MQKIQNVAVNWVMVPAPWRVDAPPRHEDQRWLLTLTGIHELGGTPIPPSCEETYWLQFDPSPIHWAHGTELQPGESLFFVLEQWAPFATVNTVPDPSMPYAGLGVSSCNVMLGTRQIFHVPQRADDPFVVDNVFEGMRVKVKPRAWHGSVDRIGFHLTLVGKILLYKP